LYVVFDLGRRRFQLFLDCRTHGLPPLNDHFVFLLQVHTFVSNRVWVPKVGFEVEQRYIRVLCGYSGRRSGRAEDASNSHANGFVYQIGPGRKVLVSLRMGQMIAAEEDVAGVFVRRLDLCGTAGSIDGARGVGELGIVIEYAQFKDPNAKVYQKVLHTALLGIIVSAHRPRYWPAAVSVVPGFLDARPVPT
jgi:hypothetical protein